MKLFAKVFLALVLLPAGIFSAQLIEEETALKDAFPEGYKTSAVKVTVEHKKDINSRLGDSAFSDLKKESEYKFYKGKEGTAILEHHAGKWGEIEVLVLIDTEGKVKNVVVLASSEKRGRPIVMRTFLNQFTGKVLKDKMEIGKAINAVTGATISSKAVCLMVKRALEVYELSAVADKK